MTRSRALPFSHLGYYSVERLAQYYVQIQAVRDSGARRILEIGPGPGLVTRALRGAGLEVRTCDIQPELAPDIVGDIRALPLPENSAEFILCCEVLEHLPFEDLPAALRECRRAASQGMLLSVPIEAHVLFSKHKLPGGSTRHWLLHFPRWRDQSGVDEEHCWEIGRKGYPKRRIARIIQQSGWTIRRAFTPVETPLTQYFLLQK